MRQVQIVKRSGGCTVICEAQSTNSDRDKELWRELKVLIFRVTSGSVALTYIYGIGPTRAVEILKAHALNPDTRVQDLTETEVGMIVIILLEPIKSKAICAEVQMNIKRLVEVGCYRGMRHRRNLPAHGQRTRTNARTAKSPNCCRSRSPSRKSCQEIILNECGWSGGVPFSPAATWPTLSYK